MHARAHTHTQNTIVMSKLICVTSIILIELLINFTLNCWHNSERTSRLDVFEECTNAFQLLFLLLLNCRCLLLQSNGNNNGQVSYKSEPLKLDVTATVPPPSTTTAPPPVTPATTSTPLSTRPRYPKEDPTLEYGAYDNPALTPSPVFENNQPETTTPVSRRQESSF